MPIPAFRRAFNDSESSPNPDCHAEQKADENCCYKPLPSFKAYKVHRIYLDTTVQGKGIGKQLMAFAEAEARRGNYDILWLDAMDTHTQAQSFYKKLGFEKTERQLLDFPLLHDQHRPMWFMHKEL